MTRREIVELLTAYGNAQQYIKDINAEMETLKSSIESMREVTAVTYSDMPKGNGIGDPTAQAAQFIIEIYEKRLGELKSNIEGILAKKALTEELLSRLSDEERCVMEEKYINGTKWDFLPARVHMSRRKCFRLKDAAFMKMCKK